jgi:Leucine Rich repeat
MRILLQQESIAQRTQLSLDPNNTSDAAFDVFGDFLREATTPCLLQSLRLWNLPPRQSHRLLEALHTNRSVKELCISSLKGDEGASCIADLLRHKKDFMELHLFNCCFPFTQILPLLRGQPNLKCLDLNSCCIGDNNIALFKDPQFTQLFVDFILLSPSTTIKTLYLRYCGVSLENQPLMTAFHKNTCIVKLAIHRRDAATRRYIEPILQRNVHLDHVRDLLLGTTTTFGDEIVVAPTIPPPCGIWATVMARVGQGTQGATPVFTILLDLLATWIVS